MICEITNKCNNFIGYMMTGEKQHIHICEYNLKDVVMTLIITGLSVLILAWWVFPLICVDKLYNNKIKPIKINWPVFKCKKGVK